mmetsp:Transcript_3577/g.5396  ORF Transcript_3577/g.5396 Transcript_3577/m.5396 type:complete len:189 (-) Transcript_3577:285-851(-)
MKSTLFALLALCVLFSSASGSALVRKYFDTNTLIAQEATQVTIIIYNVGETALHSIQVDDSNWDSNWKTSGETKFSLEKLEVGDSANFTYTVTPLAPVHTVDIDSAKVSFSHSPAGAYPEQVLSTSSTERVYRSTYYSRIYYSTPLDWVIFFICAGGATLPSFLTWFYYISNYENGIKKSVLASTSSK